jgi:hypothetical protein
VFNPTWPSFERNLDFKETNILTKIQENPMKNTVSIVLTRISIDLTSSEENLIKKASRDQRDQDL